MNLKKGMAVIVAALALMAVSAGSAFASGGSNSQGEYTFCDGQVGQAGNCVTVLAPTEQDYLKFDACLEDSGGFQQLTDVEACAQSTGYQVTRSVIDANGMIHDGTDPTAHLAKLKRHHKRKHHHRSAARTSRG
jgi:hypothetical protein